MLAMKNKLAQMLACNPATEESSRTRSDGPVDPELLARGYALTAQQPPQSQKPQPAKQPPPGQYTNITMLKCSIEKDCQGMMPLHAQPHFYIKPLKPVDPESSSNGSTYNHSNQPGIAQP